MATITLQTQMSDPAENAGTCEVLYQVTNADGLEPEIFVIKKSPPAYPGATPMQLWQHVAYADEMTTIPTTDPGSKGGMQRKAVVTVRYTSVEKANTAINSIRGQIQRLVNEINTISVYTGTNTFVISSTN